MTLIEQTKIKIASKELKILLDEKKKGKSNIIDKDELEYHKSVLHILEEYEKMKEGKNNGK